MKINNAILIVILIFSIAGVYVIDYMGGYAAFPLSIMLFPAVLVPAFFALLAFVMLSIISVKGLIRRSRTYQDFLNIGVIAILIVIIVFVPFPDYVHGLRDRIKSGVGYEGLREFAQELGGREELIRRFPEGPDSSYQLLKTPKRYGPLSKEEQDIWDEFADKYEFLHWNRGMAHVFIRNNIMTVEWGGALVGHWGFQVALHGTAFKNEDRGRYLKVEDDIQFYYVD